jgi:hypothetical protein
MEQRSYLFLLAAFLISSCQNAKNKSINGDTANARWTNEQAQEWADENVWL